MNEICANENCRKPKSEHDCLPRRWIVFLIIALASLAVVVGACLIAYALDQARIDDIPRPEPAAHDFGFYREVTHKVGDVMRKRVVEAVVWTIWPNGGYAISEGE